MLKPWLAAEKGCSNHDALHSHPRVLDWPCYPDVAGCICARTAFDASAADVDGQQPFRCRAISSPMAFCLCHLKLTHRWLRQFFFPFSRILLASNTYPRSIHWAGTSSLVAFCSPCVTCHAVTAPAVTPVTPFHASAHESLRPF